MTHSKSLPNQRQTRQAKKTAFFWVSASFRHNPSVPFARNLSVSSLILVERTDRLSRNVGKELPLLAAWQTRRTQFSSTSRRKTEVTYKRCNVRTTWQSSAFARSLLLWKCNKYYRFWVFVCSLKLCSMQWPCAISSSVAYPAPQYSSTLPHCTIFANTSLNTYCAFWFCLQSLSAIFLIIERTERDLITMPIGLHVNYALFLADSNENWIFSTHFRKIFKHQISRKSFQWESSCSMLTDRRIESTKLIQSLFAVLRTNIKITMALSDMQSSPLTAILNNTYKLHCPFFCTVPKNRFLFRRNKKAKISLSTP
jgi:hypothetical protein